jgi:hypothetical protein
MLFVQSIQDLKHQINTVVQAVMRRLHIAPFHPVLSDSSTGYANWATLIIAVKQLTDTASTALVNSKLELNHWINS